MEQTIPSVGRDCQFLRNSQSDPNHKQGVLKDRQRQLLKFRQQTQQKQARVYANYDES